ncbi:MAG: hypothetical protein Q7R41_16615, partial [Phycisphaerales bacterium]|nr:hypothetical protein [Phycisphaerales bacterium]
KAGVPYVVSANALYTIDQYGVETQVGAGIIGTGPVQMADNGTEVGTVADRFGWTYDATNGLRQITSPYFYGANSIAFFKSLFCFDRLDTNEFFHSGVLDGQSYTATNSGAAETSSDRVVAVTEHKGHLMVWGEETIEPWFFSGAVAFPFQQYDGAAIQRGLAAAGAVAKEDEALFFLGNDRMAWRLNGLQLSVQSTHAIASAWQKHSSVTDAHAFSYSFNGHKFVVFQFPTQHETWILDVATGLWHERDSLDAGGSMIRWRGNCSATAHGKVLIGDFLTGKVGYLDSSTFTDFGDTITMKLVAPVVHGDGNRVFMNYFELDIETGVGLATGQGSDPQITMSISEDAGHTYYPMEQPMSMGLVGQHRERLRWTQCGSFYDGVIKIEVTDPVRRTIVSARADVELGT